MSVLRGEAGLLPEVEEADEVAVDDGGDAALQREPEKHLNSVPKSSVFIDMTKQQLQINEWL